MQNTNNSSNSASTNEFNFVELASSYLVYWKWFVLSAFIALVGAYVYLRYTTPKYGITTTILIKDDKKGGFSNEMAAFSDLNLINGVKSSVDNEIVILKSKTLTENVVEQLGFNISYYMDGRVLTVESYKTSPVTVEFLEGADHIASKSATFYIIPSSKEKFVITDKNKEHSEEYNFGDLIKKPIGTFKVLFKVDDTEKYLNKAIIVTVKPVKSVASSYLAGLNIEPVKGTSALRLSTVNTVVDKGIDFLNTLVKEYNADAIADNNLIAKNTSDFIEGRLKIVTEELDGVEKDAEKYKKTNKLTDITSEAGLFLDNSSSYENNLVKTESELKVVNSMIDLVKKSKNEDLIPSNVIPTSSESALIGEYNQLVLKRNRLLQNSATNENPVVIKLATQIEGLRGSIKESLDNLKTSISIQKREFEQQERTINSRIGQIPTQEREFRVIDRQQKIKEALYLYLLQKREETAISLAITAPKAKVIDAAYSYGNVSPIKKNIYLGALLVGLLLPLVILYIKNFLDNTVHNRQDVEKRLPLSFIGDIPLSPEEELIIKPNSRTTLAESFRIALANLDFLLAHTKPGMAKTIFVTSTIPKEGKTFASVNIATTLANYGKKVLLVGMDLRHPKIEHYIDGLPANGLSNYLANDKIAINDVIYPHKQIENLYVLHSGVIPPNPAELLNTEKVQQLFESFKLEYDYIVVDTAPVGLVTDTLLISKFADVFIYVIRANYLKKKALVIPKDLHVNKKLPNMTVLLNGTDLKKNSGGYGYGYGYGYGAYLEDKNEKVSWYKKWFSKKS